MSRYSEIEADMAEILADVGTQIQWDGDDYDAILTEPRVDLDLTTGGFSAEADYSIKIRKTDLPEGSAPQAKDQVAIAGAIYVVRGITDSPSSPMLVLHVARK
ncbi:hypothetical protein EBS40_09240 [bacterium]|nr:hypothetical protein [bacterium]